VRRLVLFDIDGTLLSTDGRAGEALGRALVETFGTAGPIEGYRFAGKTDPQIVVELLGAAGLATEAVLSRIDHAFESYCGHLRRALTRGNTRVLPGVRRLLANLERHGDAEVGLLTGNIASGAQIKLAAAGLAGRFAIGAFGSDHADRDRLVAIARMRAMARWGDPFSGRRTVVVGDAQADVRCARAGGAWSVAVASGKTPRGDLAAMGPDVLLDSLAQRGALAAVLGPAE
jgi:phosphoglycolate phosphatase